MKKIILSLVLGFIFFVGTAEVRAKDLECNYTADKGVKMQAVFIMNKDGKYYYKEAKYADLTNNKTLELMGPYKVATYFNSNNGCPVEFKQYELLGQDKYPILVFKDLPLTNMKLHRTFSVDNNVNTELEDAKNSGDPNISNYAKKAAESAVSCNYKLDNGQTEKISLTKDGRIWNINNSYYLVDGSAQIMKDSISQDKNCPPAICINKKKISISRDVNYNCGGITNTLKDRQKIQTTKIGVFSAADAKVASSHLTALKNTSSSLAKCFKTVDTSSKCTKEYTDYNKAIYATSSRGATFEETSPYFYKYKTCIEDKYKTEDINAKCSKEDATFNDTEAKAAAYAKESNNPMMNSLSHGSAYNPSSIYSLTDLSCEDILGEDLIELMKKGFLILQIFALVIAVVLSALDFLKALSSNEADANKKAFKKLTTRLIVVVILLILPTLIELLLETFEINNVKNKNPFCE